MKRARLSWCTNSARSSAKQVCHFEPTVVDTLASEGSVSPPLEAEGIPAHEKRSPASSGARQSHARLRMPKNRGPFLIAPSEPIPPPPPHTNFYQSSSM